MNGEETDVDCGGALCSPCANGSACIMPSDCSSKVCTDGVCVPATCEDGIKNQDETGRDCGGIVCSPCGDGLGCMIDSDCESTRCWMGRCVSCANQILDGDESDVDCGGTGCEACGIGAACTMASDCVSNVCDAAMMVCNAPGCGDGVANGMESDVDCGGGECIACADGRSCLNHSDCLSGACDAGTCVPPSCTDGLRNGGESDVDCGGATTCDRCPDLSTCTDPSDCAAGACMGGYCGTMPCGPHLLRIHELHGGDGPRFDFIEILNRSGCDLDLSGVEIATQHNCSTPVVRYTFPAGTRLGPMEIALLRDMSATPMPAGEYYAGGICWDPGSEGWTAICDGACDLNTCTNFVDYHEQNDVAGRPREAPSCASFSPAPFDASALPNSSRTDSVHRVAYDGSGAAGVASDWAIGPYTR